VFTFVFHEDSKQQTQQQEEEQQLEQQQQPTNIQQTANKAQLGNYPYEVPTTLNALALRRGGNLSSTMGPRLPESHSANEAQCCDSEASLYSESAQGSRVQAWGPCHH